MSFLHLFADLASAAAEGVAQHQMQQQQQPTRTVRRKNGCTPCEAMAQVDAARKQLGFGAAAKKVKRAIKK